MHNIIVYVGDNDSTSKVPASDQQTSLPQTTEMLDHDMCDFLSCNLTQGINTFTCSSGQITGRYVFVEGQKCSGVSFKMWITEVKVCGVCKVLENC